MEKEVLYNRIKVYNIKMKISVVDVCLNKLGLLSLFFFFIIILPCFSINPHHNYINLGSAKKLEGNIMVISCFVSTNNDRWNRNEKEDMLQLLFEAQTWLKKECQRYNSSVNFVNLTYGYNEMDYSLDNLPKGPNEGDLSFGIIKNTMKSIGYIDQTWYCQIPKFASEKKCENSLIIVFPKSKGRSYSRPYCQQRMMAKCYDDFMEGCIIYQTDTSGKTPLSSSIAHEILHLFGGWDFYSDKFSEQSENSERIAKQKIPQSIMLSLSHNIYERQIDEVTAWLIGVSGRQETWYNNLEPQGE